MPAREPKSNQRFRVSRARMAYLFERYAIADELVTIPDAMALLGVTREAIAMMVLKGQLAVVDPLTEYARERLPRFLLRAEIDALLSLGRVDQVPLQSVNEDNE